MSDYWLISIDVLFCAFIMFFLIGQRFNQWPGETQSLFSGKPSDYIDPFRYYTFYFIYICAFIVVGMAIYNLQLALPENLRIQKSFKEIVEKLGSQSWTIAALYLLAFVNERHVKKWDSKWRNRLQMWARIPKAVEEMRDNLLFAEDSLTPTRGRLEDLRSELKKLGVEAHWEPVIDNWQRERKNSSLDWHFLKALYTLRICKKLRVATLNPGDIDRHEKRLHDLARDLPKLDWKNEDVQDYMEEVNKLFAYFVESLCKHIIRKKPSKIVQRDTLHNLGFRPHFYDVPEIKILGVTANCLVCLSIVCLITIIGYLSVLDWTGKPFRPDEPWFSWTRILKWSLGSVISYSMAIFIAVIIEKSASPGQNQPKIFTYITTLIFSTLVSLTYFHVSNPGRAVNWSAFTSLALSMGIVGLVVIRALTKPTCKSRKEVWVSSLSHAALLGLFAALFQILAAVSFRGADAITLISMMITAIYGFVKGSMVIFIVSYLIQHSIRRQLIVAQRQTPRVKFKARLSAILENKHFDITTRNISKGGLLIEPGIPLDRGQLIDLNFAFGVIQAKVKWVSKKFAGLTFTEDSSNNAELRGFIRNQIGASYA
jgi:hypothetical protein